jgi:hypothetical protein
MSRTHDIGFAPPEFIENQDASSDAPAVVSVSADKTCDPSQFFFMPPLFFLCKRFFSIIQAENFKSDFWRATLPARSMTSSITRYLWE